MEDQKDEKAIVYPTGYSFSKNGVNLNFQADIANRKVLLVGQKTVALDVDEAHHLIEVIQNMINMVNDKEIKEPVREIDFQNLPKLT